MGFKTQRNKLNNIYNDTESNDSNIVRLNILNLIRNESTSLNKITKIQLHSGLVSQTSPGAGGGGGVVG